MIGHEFVFHSSLFVCLEVPNTVYLLPGHLVRSFIYVADKLSKFARQCCPFNQRVIGSTWRLRLDNGVISVSNNDICGIRLRRRGVEAQD